MIDGGLESAGGRLDLTTGDAWPRFALEGSFDDGDEDDPDGVLHVWPTGSRRAYTDMVDSPPHGWTSGYVSR